VKFLNVEKINKSSFVHVQWLCSVLARLRLHSPPRRRRRRSSRVESSLLLDAACVVCCKRGHCGGGEETFLLPSISSFSALRRGTTTEVGMLKLRDLDDLSSGAGSRVKMAAS
jgi:hypothetical protein